MNESTTNQAERIIEIEQAALQRWCTGDPSGFAELLADDVTYFDPFLERRLDGRERLCAYYEALRGKIHAKEFRMLNPLVLLEGKIAVLTFNFTSRDAQDHEMRWNCTEVYRNQSNDWRLVQTHWSFAK